jgi:hypothetical protein
MRFNAVRFEQAAIKVEREQEFSQLKSALTKVFAANRVEKLLQRLKSRGIRIRDFDLVLSVGILDQLDEAVGKPGSAQKLYNGLAVSDQAQIREFYLSKIEEVDSALRTKYQKLYRYY